MKSVYVASGGLVGELFPAHLAVTFCGKLATCSTFLPAGSFVSLTVRLHGGKGGYGQLLKDFGKETALSRNKKSMRDLSGRMIRDLDDMKDFKTWLDTRHERAKKKEDEKVARLKRALIEPKHMMDSSEHYAAKEKIEEEQSDALKVAMKRKLELDKAAEEKLAKKKKKKWYENSSDEEEEKKPEIKVRPPSEIRRQHQIEQRDQKLKTKLGKAIPKTLNELEKPKFKIQKGMVMVAPEATIELEKETEIWEDDFLETVDPELIKEYQIQKRDQLYREQQEKEAKAAEDKSKKAETSKPEKPAQNFEDINLDDIDDPIQLEFYGMDHLKFVLEAKGLKCGGSLQERCKRLLMTKGKTPDQYPKKIRAKK